MNYKTYSLEQLVTIKYGKNQKKVTSVEGTVPIYGTGGLMGFATKALYEKPSVLIGRKGTISKVKYVEQPFWTVDTLFYTEINDSIVCPKYLYYLMSLLDLSIYNEGTTIPSLRTETLYKLEFSIPPIEYQEKLVAFLEPFDKKIETNTKINENLEQQAQSIYEEFLSNHQTFPVTIGDIVLTANTGADAIQKAPIVDYDSGIRCVRVGDLSNQRPVYEWGFTKVTSEIFKRYQLHKDDIVVTRTASLGLNQLIGEDLNAVYNNGLIRISINDDIVYPLIVYRQFQTKDYRNYISRITGETSVRPNMKINYLLKYKFEILEKAEQTELVHIIQPLFEAQERNTSENLLLSSLRDALLPKLMSGELDVSNLDL